MTEPLAMARTLRATLRDSVVELEQAAAGPASAPEWRAHLADRLHRVRTALISHMEEVETEGGLLDQIAASAAGLGESLERIRQEHGELLEDVDQVLDVADAGTGADPDDVRAAVLDLMTMIARHRQHGADVVYAAFGVDVGA